jgi:hypothetical protein
MTKLLKDFTYDNVKKDILENNKNQREYGNKKKFQVLSILIRKDDIENQNMKNDFSKTGPLYDQRAWLSEAKFIFKAMENKEKIGGKEYHVNDILNFDIDDLPFSMGTEVKKLRSEKSEKSDNSGKSKIKADKELMQGAINNPNLDTGMIESVSEFNKKLNSDNEIIANAARDILNQQKKFDMIMSMPTFSEKPQEAEVMLNALIAGLYEVADNAGEILRDIMEKYELDQMADLPEELAA